MEQEIETADSLNSEINETEIVAEDTSGLDAAALQAKLAETEAKNKQLFERAKKAEGFVLKEGKWVKAEKPAPAPQREVVPEATTGELDETQLLWLEVKGVKTDDADEMGLVEKWRTETGKKVKEIHASKIFQAELKELRDGKAALEGTPSSTKRGGGSATDNVDYWFQKYEQTGKLPENMPKGMAEKLVNRKAAQSDSRQNPYE